MRSTLGGRRRGTVDRVSVVVIASVIILAAGIGALSEVTSNGDRSPSAGGGAPPTGAGPGELRSFQNASQLQAFVAENAESAQSYDRYGGASFIGGPVMLAQFGFGTTTTVTLAVTATMTSTATGPLTALQASVASTSGSSPSYTGTNDQVQGVDEPDIVKTDGSHLFAASTGGAGSTVSIISAYPVSSASVLSQISVPGEVLGIEIQQDRLMVIDQSAASTGYFGGSTTIGLLLYNTTDLSSPRLMDNESVAGTYVAARLNEGYLYAIVQQPSYTFSDQGNATGVMPYTTLNGDTTALPPTSVYYSPNGSQIGDYTMVVSVSMATGAEETLSVLTGPSSTVYVSNSNIYVVYSDYLMFPDVDGIPGNVYSGGLPLTSPSVQQNQNSTIFRAAYNAQGNVTVQAVGEVPGSILNQYSMDEYDGYFRVATSYPALNANGTYSESDSVYVLSESMTQVSSLTNIAPGENLYAVRFDGLMGYVVTFEQVDPLFAISFADIQHPTIVSALKVNGYSDYLQPLFGGTYLLGIGKDTVASSNGDFSYYLGLKLSLFHVESNGTSSDVQDFMIGDRGTDSPVLTDPLALTYDPANNITVIPVLLAEVPANEQSTGTSSQSPPPEGNPVWQGAYVFRVSSTGLTLLGNVTQYPAGQNYGSSPDGNLQIERSVIIGNYLYTISNGEVMISDLSSFATLVALPI